MEQIKDWLMVQLIDFGIGIAFFIFLVLVFGIWSICEYLEDKEWNIFIKIFLGLVILIVGIIIINITIALGVKDLSLFWFDLIKSVIDGMLIPLVFFKIIPRKGKYVALFFVLVVVTLLMYSVYFGMTHGYYGGIVEALALGGSNVITYLVLLKGNLIERDN